MAIATGTAMLIGGGLGAAASLYGAKKSSDSLKDATREGVAAEGEMAEKNLAFQREMAEQQRGDFAPWRDAGQQALQQIQEGIKSGAFEVGKVDVKQDPGYQFRMNQGIEARDKSAAARGRLLSGAQNKAITEYGQDYGSNEYAKAYAREADQKARRFNMLSSLSQGGQSSAAGQAQAASQLASTSGNIMSSLGRSQNVAQQRIGAARAGAYGDMAQTINQAAQNWVTYKNT